MNKRTYKQIANLIFFKAIYNLRSEATTTRLGYAWWVIEPVLHMLTFYLVFSFLLNRGGENYITFLFSGLIPWLWFTKSVNRGQGSILGGKQLMNQLYLPKIIFPLILIVQDTIKQLAIFTVLIVGLVLMGAKLSYTWFWLVPIFIAQWLLICGCALFAAMLVPFFRDLKNLIPPILQFLMFSSGVFFNYKDIPEIYHFYFFLNPVAVFIRCYRDVLIDGVPPDLFLLSYLITIGAVLLTISVYYINKFDYLYPRIVSE